MTTVAIAHPAAEQAERLIAEVRDDPAARIRFASDAYAGSARYRSYASAVVAFMSTRLRLAVRASSGLAEATHPLPDISRRRAHPAPGIQGHDVT
jgi:hypothetical protein